MDRMSQFTDEHKTPDLDHMSADEYNTLSKYIFLQFIIEIQ